MQIMPFDEARTYRFNPFDLTKVWPHADYPLIEVGRMTLNRNPTDNHTEIEQAAFDVSNLVPGIGPSPDKMLLGRIFSYADAHRARIGVNYKQIPVNRPKVPVHSYSKDGRMRVENVSDPVYAPNSKGGPKADPVQYPQVEVWGASGEFIHAAYTKRKDDDDFGQAGTLVRKVMDNAARDRLDTGLNKGRTPANVAQAHRFLDRALAADSDNVDALVQSARAYVVEGALSFVTDPIAAFAAAESKLTKALSSVPDHALPTCDWGMSTY
jgi:catalase